MIFRTSAVALFKRLVTLAGESPHYCLMARGGTRTADVLRRRSALYRLAVSRFGWLPACSGAPSHYLPQASGQGIVAGQVIRAEGPWICPSMSALGQKQTSKHVRAMSALPPKADIGT